MRDQVDHDAATGNDTFTLVDNSSGLHGQGQRRSSGAKINSTFEVNRNNELNATFDLDPSPPPNDHHLTRGGLNATFSRKTSSVDLDGASSTTTTTTTTNRLSRFSSEDRLSTTSDSSVSHQLNDVGDVQTIARLQEESE